MSALASSAAGETDGPASFLLSVVCELCYRDFLLADSSLAVPFCVSSCGHIFCNEHRRHADQCPECGRQGVAVEPLTAQPPAPIAHFFDGLPRTLQHSQQAASFQLAHLYKIIRFFKDKVVKQRDVLNEVRSRLEASTKTAERVAALERENARLVSELERLTQRSMPPPPPIPHGDPPASEQRKRKRDGFNALGESFARPESPTSRGSGDRPSAPQRYTLPQNGGRAPTTSSHAIDGRQSRTGVERSSGGISGLQQFAYRPPPDRSRAPTPRPGTSAGGLQQVNGYLASPSAGRPPFLAQANAYNRQAHPTPTSTRLQAAQLAGALPPRASTSQLMRSASVQPMPIPQPPRPSSSRTVFTNDPRDPRSFPRQAAFEPLRPRQPPPQQAYSTGSGLEPGYGQQAAPPPAPFPTRASFVPSTSRRMAGPSYGYGAQEGDYAGDPGPPQGGPPPPPRPIFHQAGRG